MINAKLVKINMRNVCLSLRDIIAKQVTIRILAQFQRYML